MLKFNVFLVVWGAPYIDVMVKLIVPTLLYPGNVPALASRHHCKVVFFTRANEEELIRGAESVKRLAELVPIEFVHFDPDAFPNVYVAMSHAHLIGCRRAKEEGAKVIVSAPDILFADGCCAEIARQAEAGKTAVMCAGPRLLQEEALAALLPRISTPMTSREMVSATIDYLHPETQRFSVETEDFYPYPSHLIWPLGRKGLIQRAFHLHPIMIDASRIDSFDALNEQTIDGALLGGTLNDWSTIHIVTDSDSLYMCSLTPRDAFYTESTGERFGIERVHRTAYSKMVNDLHRFFFTKAVKLHTDDLDSEWEEAERATGWVVEAIRFPPPPEPEVASTEQEAKASDRGVLTVVSTGLMRFKTMLFGRA
jgi:hypothetical protein